MDGITLAFIATGFGIGVLSGTLGIGGAIVLVPALMFGFGFSQGRAQGTSIGALVPPIGIFAALQYYRNGMLDVRAAGLIASGFVFGALAGAAVVPYVPAVWLRRAFAAVLVYVAAQLMFVEPGKKTASVLPGAVAVGLLWAVWGVKRLVGKRPPKPKRPAPPPDTEYFI
jgi:uncharacterized membrane protein YfcA